MNRILLTGAGFSRNWGGWLADEAFEYLLGCPEVDHPLRELLWRSKAAGGGFEDALAELQLRYLTDRSTLAEGHLRAMNASIDGMFNSMNQAFEQTVFEPQNQIEFLVRTFLIKFDAVFTLNQDMLLERHYLDGNIQLGSAGRWRGWQIPGMKPTNHGLPQEPGHERMVFRTPDPTHFNVEAGLQPYIKLHGSSNWIVNETGSRLLVMGGNKAEEIGQHAILKWYHRLFAERLMLPNTRLMVIGYSFSDRHINDAIMKAAEGGNLRLFIVDFQGVNVLDKQSSKAPIRAPSELMVRLNPHIYGASRRPLTAIFGSDRVEHRKLMRFLNE